MKIFLLSAALFTQLSFANHLGEKVLIYTDGERAKFGVMFANDSNKVWILNVTLWAPHLTPSMKMKTLAWRLFDSSTGHYLNGWRIAVQNVDQKIYNGTLALTLGLENEQGVFETVKAQPHLKLLLAVDQDLAAPVPTHYVDLGSYCSGSADQFMDLTTGKTGCNSN